MPRRAASVRLVIDVEQLRPVFNNPRPYNSGEDLFECAFAGGPALPLVQLALNLRENERSYRSLDWIKARWANRDTLHNIKQRVKACFFMYTAMLQLARPLESQRLRSANFADLMDATRDQRSQLQGLGVINVRGHSITTRALQARTETEQRTQNGVCTIWIDNYHRHRYATTPAGNRDQSFTATSVAVLPAQFGVDLPQWAGWPSPATLVDRATASAQALLRATVALREAVKPFITNDGLGRDVLRVPLDVKRPHVTPSAWLPYAVWDNNVSAGAGFQEVLRKVLVLAGNRSAATPVLMDVDLWWRVVKVVYLETNGRAMPIRSAMTRFVPLFGIWHAYKHCVQAAYQKFLPFLVPLEYEKFVAHPETTNVFTNPALIATERLLLATYFASRSLRLQWSGTHVPQYEGPGALPDNYSEQWDGLRTLCLRIIPALIVLGIRVRSCSWNVCRGDGARAALQAALVLCEILTPEKQDGNYKNALRVCLLFWDDFLDALPGAAHCEEKCEALLSRLARVAKRNPNIVRVSQYDEVFVALKVKKATVKRTDGYVSKTACADVERRFQRLLNYMKAGKLPWIVRPAGTAGKSTHIQGTHQWPARHTFPKMEMSTWTVDSIVLKFYGSLAVLFTHGVYIPRPIGDNRRMSTNHKRALSNYMCAKHMCQWAFGHGWQATGGDNPDFYLKFRRGLEACRACQQQRVRR